MIPNMIRFVNRLLRYKTMLRTFQMPLVLAILSKYIDLFRCTECQVLPVHRYSVDIFSYSGPSRILGSDGKQNTTKAGGKGRWSSSDKSHIY